jgi:3-oxoacyl-[acyl-carrier protein] reductase
MSPTQRETTISRVPVGRFARPDEMASVVLFLLSDAASFVIGETINVNGGSYLD